MCVVTAASYRISSFRPQACHKKSKDYTLSLSCNGEQAQFLRHITLNANNGIIQLKLTKFEEKKIYSTESHQENKVMDAQWDSKQTTMEAKKA